MADNNLLILQELNSRRGSLPPDKVAILNELNSRFGATKPVDRSAATAAISIASPALGLTYEAARKFPQAFQNQGFIDKNILQGQLPMIGSALGGILGAFEGPQTAVGGAGLGGMIGRGGQDIARALVGLSPSQSIQNAAMNQIKSGITGMTGEMGGQILGKVIPPVLQMAGKGVMAIPGVAPAKNFIQNKIGNLVQRIATPAVPQTAATIGESLQQGDPTLGQEMAQRGLYGFRRKIGELALKTKGDIGAQIDNHLSQYADAGIDPTKMVQGIEDLQARFLRTGNAQAAKLLEQRKSAWLASILDKNTNVFKGTTQQAVQNGLLTPAQANILKREFAAEARSVFNQDSYDAVSGVNGEFAKAMSDSLRKEIEKVAPGIRGLNKDYHFFDNFVDAIYLGLGRDLNKGLISISNPLSAAGVGGLGYAATSSVPGAALAVGATQLGKTFPVRSFISAQLSKLSGKTITPALAENISSQVMGQPQLRDAVFRAIANVRAAQDQKK